MGYPVAYRKTANPTPRGPGSQPAPSGLPKPANDNQPIRRWPTPKPANDNGPLGGFGPKAKPFVRGAMRLGRLSPVGRFYDLYKLGEYALNMYDLQQQPMSKQMWNSGGAWQVIKDCGCPVTYFSRDYATCTGTPCFAFPDSGTMRNPPRPTDRTIGAWGTVGAAYINGTIMVWTSQIWQKPLGDPTPWRIERWMPYVQPGVNPMIDPFTLPMVPARSPKQLPFKVLPQRVPNPNRSPTEQDQRGYETASDYNPLIPGPRQVEIPAPGVKPRPVPGHQPAKPGPGVKERKTALRRGMVVALRAGYTATEAIDAIEAIHKALPKKYRAPSGSTPQEKLAAIYRHYDKLDMNKVVLNLIANHILDAIIGRSSAKAAEFFRRYRISGYGQHF